MACDFAAYRVTDSGRIVLVHPSGGPADTGFGPTPGTSSVTVQPIGGQAVAVKSPTVLWLPNVIVADLPDDLPTGAATVRVQIGGASPCSSSAALGEAGTTLPSDLLFAIAIPEAATPGAKVTVVNLKPGFVWGQQHLPVGLHRLAGDAAIPVTGVIDGIGKSRLTLTLPSTQVLALQGPAEQMLLSFGASSQRVPAVIQKAVDLGSLADWADLALAIPAVAQPGTAMTLQAPQPPAALGLDQYTFNQGDLGALGLYKAGGQSLVTDLQPTGWGTPELSFVLPGTDVLNLTAGTDVATFLRFSKRPPTSRIGMTVRIPALPQLASWLRIGRLTAVKRNEWWDETQLEVILDGVNVRMIPTRLPGDSRPPYDTFDKDGDARDYDVWVGPFLSTAEIRVWEVDNGRTGGVLGIDPDDLIASRTLGPQPTSVTDLEFVGADAKYSLSHFVSSLPVGVSPS